MTTRNGHFISILLFTSIVLYSFNSCNSTSKEGINSAAEEVILSKEHYDETKEDLNQEVEKYKQETNDKVAENEKKLAEYRIKVASDKTKVKTDYEQQIAKLDEKNAALKRRVDAFVAGDKLNWEAFKQKCSKEMISLDGDICNVCGPQY
jgi:exonuclease VII large subunit